MQIVLIALRIIYFAPISTKTTVTIDRKPWCEIVGDQGKRNITYQSRKKTVVCCMIMTFGFLELHTKSKRE